MYKLGLSAFIGIAFYVGVALCGENGTFLESAADMVFHFPQYLEEAINLEIEEDQKSKEYLLGMGQCKRDFLHIFGGIRKKEEWALRVIDSWGKLPSGILSGSMFDLGDFDECLNIDSSAFVPRYCLARVSKDELLMPNKNFIGDGLSSLTKLLGDFQMQNFGEFQKPQTKIVPTKSNMIGLNFGICIPKSCTPEKMNGLLAKVQKKIFRNKAVLSLVPDTCQVKEDQQWNLRTADYVILSFLLFLAFLMVTSTIYDIVQTRRDKEKMLGLIAFSVYTNGKKIFATKRTKSEYTMECLNGIRVFSALWVMYAHAHVMVMLGPVFNFAYIPEWASHYSTTVLLMAPFSVDSFLFLSGLLVTWSLLKHLNKTNGNVNYFMLYVHRYLRLTPILAVIIFISMTIFKRIGSGPLWYSYVLNAINCDEYWWSSLLYIQNYYNPDNFCLSHTWYLSADMQLFLIAPLFGYLLYRFGYIIVVVLVLLVGGCVGWTYWLYSHFNLINQILNIKNDIQETFRLTYFPTHIRMTPWLFGVMFAYFLFKMHGKRERWHKVRVVIHWLITFAILGVLMYYTYELQQMDHEATSTESGLYTSFSRVGWSVFLCLVIYACVKGYGGPVNWFLSLAMWQPFARLTYAIYLVHMPIMLMVAAGTHRSLYFSGQNILFKFFGDFLAATLLSIIASLALESPIVVLEKIIFSPRKKPNVIPTTQREEPTAPENSP